MRYINIKKRLAQRRSKKHGGLPVTLPWIGLYAVPPHLKHRLEQYGVI